MNKHHDQLIHDIFVTAIEGGVNYWASVSNYKWSTGDGSTEDLEGFSCILHDEEDEDAEPYAIDRAVIRRGYRLAASKEWRNRIRWSSENPPLIVDEDGWDVDAGDADNILQLGIFGEIVYG